MEGHEFFFIIIIINFIGRWVLGDVVKMEYFNMIMIIAMAFGVHKRFCLSACMCAFFFFFFSFAYAYLQ